MRLKDLLYDMTACQLGSSLSPHPFRPLGTARRSVIFTALR